MDYKKLYAEKLVSAEKAASVVKSGDWVDYGWTTGTPVAVDAAIAKRLPELENVNFRGGILMWVPEIFKIENPAAPALQKPAVIFHKSFHCGAADPAVTSPNESALFPALPIWQALPH